MNVKTPAPGVPTLIIDLKKGPEHDMTQTRQSKLTKRKEFPWDRILKYWES